MCGRARGTANSAATRRLKPLGQIWGVTPTNHAISLRMASVYALVVAAGRGSRFGGALPKQYLELGDASVLRHAVAAFAEHPRVADVLVAIRPEDRELFDRAVAGLE